MNTKQIRKWEEWMTYLCHSRPGVSPQNALTSGDRAILENVCFVVVVCILPERMMTKWMICSNHKVGPPKFYSQEMINEQTRGFRDLISNIHNIHFSLELQIFTSCHTIRDLWQYFFPKCQSALLPCPIILEMSRSFILSHGYLLRNGIVFYLGCWPAGSMTGKEMTIYDLSCLTS